MTPRATRSFSTAILTTSIGQAAQFMANVLSGILLSRFMGPAGRGLLAAAQLYPAFVQSFAELGARQALIRVAASRRFSPEQLFSSMACVYAATSSIGLGLAVVLGRYLGSSSLTVQLILLGAANLPPTLAIVCLRGLLVGSGRVRSFASLGAMTPVIGLFSFGGLIACHRLSPQAALLVVVAANVPALWVGLRLVPRGGRADVRTEIIREVTTLGWRMAALSLVTTAGSRIPMMLLQFYRPVEQIGIYAVASALAELPFQLSAATNAVTVARSAGAVDRGGFLREYLRVHRMLLWLCALICVIAGLLAPFAIPLVYGRDFAPAAEILWWLTPSILAGLSVRVLSYDSAGQGRPLEAAVWMLPGLVIALLVGLGTVPHWGMRGAAISAGAGALVNAFTAGFRFLRQNRVEVWQMCGVFVDDWYRASDLILRFRLSRKQLD